jgi:RNA polymerase sigma-70 factor (ECF subfamily)
MASEATSEMPASKATAGKLEATACPNRIGIAESLAAQLHHQAGAEKFGVTVHAFAAVLEEVATRYLPAAASSQEISDFLSHLRVEELALARGCALGSETAWEVFLTRYREKLYNAARTIVQGDANARELADSLYADLYGTRSTDGRRISKLNSFTGRGSLEGWLRAVLAQEYVNRFRRQQRLVSLEEQAEAGAQFEAESPDPTQAIDARLRDVTDQALASLAPEDKFILANYYLDGRTLAEIARLLSVHESTISRKLEKITAAIRKAILFGLMKRGMSRKEAKQTMEVEVTGLSLDVRRRLLQESGRQTVP